MGRGVGAWVQCLGTDREHVPRGSSQPACWPPNHGAISLVLTARQSRVCGIWLPADSRKEAGFQPRLPGELESLTNSLIRTRGQNALRNGGEMVRGDVISTSTNDL